MEGKNYSHQLDAKNRMRIPAKLREELGDSYYITVGTGGCLFVCTEEEMSEKKAFLKSVNPYKAEEMKIARYILANTWHVEEDKQGRILIPDNLRSYAKLTKNLKVFRGPNYVEIWAEEVWNEYFSDIDFGVLANAFDNFNGKNDRT